MQIRYSQHIKKRLELRKIEYSLPQRVFEGSEERYLDQETGHLIATMKVELYGKDREVMVAYVERDDGITLLTIHPLKSGQKENRIKTGRWRKV